MLTSNISPSEYPLKFYYFFKEDIDDSIHSVRPFLISIYLILLMIFNLTTLWEFPKEDAHPI
jgi:hypothetical protein